MRAAVCHLIEDAAGRLARDHRVGDGIRMALVRVTRLADPAAQLDALALLDDVCCLVCRRVQIGRFAKGYRRARRIRRRAYLLAGFGCRAADVRLDARHVVAPEQRLDMIAVRQRFRCTRDAALRRSYHVPIALAVGFPLDRLRDGP